MPSAATRSPYRTQQPALGCDGLAPKTGRGVRRARALQHGVPLLCEQCVTRSGSFVVALGISLAIGIGVHPAAAEPVFTYAEASAGINFVHQRCTAGCDFEHNLLFAHGSAAADYDDDGWVDIYIANGDGYPNALYHNNGDGTFTDVAVQADVDLTDRESKGALFLDYDADGDLDLFVMNDADAGTVCCDENAVPPVLCTDSTVIKHTLFQNQGNGQFVDVSNAAQLPTHLYRHITSAFTCTLLGGVAAADVTGDGYPEIYLSYWKDADTLWLNNGDGTFTDISEDTAIGNNNYLLTDNWTPLFFDANEDGLLDISVNVDFGKNLLFLNQDMSDGLPVFDEVSAEWGLDKAKWNEMGQTLGDFDNDGDFDIYMTNLELPEEAVGDPDFPQEDSEKWNRFFERDRQGESLPFVPIEVDLKIHRTGWGWGCTFFDYNNDGWVDLAVVNGHDQPEDGDVYETDVTHMFRNNGNRTFTDVSEAVNFQDNRIARSCIALDYDRDGDRDLFVTNYLESSLLFRNDGGDEAGNWVVVNPIGRGKNTRAIGARVYARTGTMEQMRLITAGTSFLSQEPDEAHFGVGTADTIDEIRVVWPDGTESVLPDQDANQWIKIRQGLVGMVVVGPTAVEGDSVTAYTAMFDYLDGVDDDVTADAEWSLVAGAQYAEVNAAGVLTAYPLPEGEALVNVTLRVKYETQQVTLPIEIADPDQVDIVPPVVTITGPSDGISAITDSDTIAVTGTAQDDESGIVSITWANDRGGNGPCSGLSTWTTGSIALAEGENVVTITAHDGRQNAASASMLVAYVLVYEDCPLPPPNDNNDNEDSSQNDNLFANTNENEPPPINDNVVTPPLNENDNTVVETNDNDLANLNDNLEPPPPRTGGKRNANACGAFGMLTLGLTLLGLSLLRRRHVHGANIQPR